MSNDAIRLYTVREAAAILRVHQRTVLRWVKSGRIAARRIGRQIRIAEEALRNCGEPVARTAGSEPAESGGGSIDPVSGFRRGSPEALLSCAGLISEEDADALMAAIREAHD